MNTQVLPWLALYHLTWVWFVQGTLNCKQWKFGWTLEVPWLFHRDTSSNRWFQPAQKKQYVVIVSQKDLFVKFNVKKSILLLKNLLFLRVLYFFYHLHYPFLNTSSTNFCCVGLHTDGEAITLQKSVTSPAVVL